MLQQWSALWSLGHRLGTWEGILGMVRALNAEGCMKDEGLGRRGHREDGTGMVRGQHVGQHNLDLGWEREEGEMGE